MLVAHRLLALVVVLVGQIQVEVDVGVEPCEPRFGEQNALRGPACAQKRESCARTKPRDRGSTSKAKQMNIVTILLKLRPENTDRKLVEKLNDDREKPLFFFFFFFFLDIFMGFGDKKVCPIWDRRVTSTLLGSFDKGVVVYSQISGVVFINIVLRMYLRVGVVWGWLVNRELKIMSTANDDRARFSYPVFIRSFN